MSGAQGRAAGGNRSVPEKKAVSGGNGGMKMRAWIAACVGLGVGVLFFARGLWAQQSQPAQSQPAASQPGNTTTALGGVEITSGGLLSMREIREAPAEKRAGDPSLVYVSLAGIIQQLHQSAANHQPVPQDVRYLHGLVRVDDLFVFPDKHDLVIAGAGEPFGADNPAEPEGTVTHRPVLQAEDLVTALRAVHGAKDGTIFGCSLDLAPGAQQMAEAVSRRMVGMSAAAQAEALQQALGPQVVRVLGVPADSRAALVMVTADYRLKRMAMGAEDLPGVGNALSSGIAANRVWFEPAYDPLAVSADGLSYGISGPRLKVLAGAQEFAQGGATTAASAFAHRISQKMPDVAARLPAVADMQNLTDLFLLASLIEHDHLDQKAGLDLSRLLNSAGADSFHPAHFPEPHTAQTVISDNGSAIAEGGVLMNLALLNLPEKQPKADAFSALRAWPAESWFLARPAAK